jgi:hypothetical protein
MRAREVCLTSAHHGMPVCVLRIHVHISMQRQALQLTQIFTFIMACLSVCNQQWRLFHF